MPYTQNSRLRQMLVVGAMAIVAVAPTLANAQFEANKLYGKKFEDVKKMFGKPLATAGKPINFSRFKTNDAVDTKVWYFFDTGFVGKVQVEIPAKPGETADDALAVLKRYKLSIGSNPKVYPGVKLPSKAMVSVGKVEGMPWTKVFISYKVAQSYKPETMKYCKERNLDPTKTYFWTILLTNRNRSGQMMSIGGG